MPKNDNTDKKKMVLRDCVQHMPCKDSGIYLQTVLFSKQESSGPESVQIEAQAEADYDPFPEHKPL